MSNPANRIRQAREAAGLTQEQLAERIGSGRVSISRWEIGESEPSVYVLDSIGYRTGVNPDWMRTGEGPMYQELGVAEGPTPYICDPVTGSASFPPALVYAVVLGLEEGLAMRKAPMLPKVKAELVVDLCKEVTAAGSKGEPLPLEKVIPLLLQHLR